MYQETTKVYYYTPHNESHKGPLKIEVSISDDIVYNDRINKVFILLEELMKIDAEVYKPTYIDLDKEFITEPPKMYKEIESINDIKL